MPQMPGSMGGGIWTTRISYEPLALSYEQGAVILSLSKDLALELIRRLINAALVVKTTGVVCFTAKVNKVLSLRGILLFAG